MRRLNSIMLRGIGCWLIYALGAVACWVAVDVAYAAQDQRPKRVLIISTGSRFSPGFALADRAVLEALGKLPLRATELYGENLDLLLFPSDRFAKNFW